MIKASQIKKLNKNVNNLEKKEEFINDLKQTIKSNHESINKFAIKNKFKRNNIHKILRHDNKNPGFDTMFKILQSAGLQISVKCNRDKLETFGNYACCEKHHKESKDE